MKAVMRLTRFNIIIPALVALAVAGIIMIRSRQPATIPPPVERLWPVMGTFASVTLRGDDAGHLEWAAAETTRLMEEFNRLMSVYIPDSELSRLNTSTNPVHISPQTRDMLVLARHYTRLSGGVFDPTAMPLIRLWGFSGGRIPEALPTEDAIAAAKAYTGIDKLEIAPDSARFTEPGVMMDLGGIAKGFAVDRCYEAIIGQRALNAIFNLGGNIRCHGKAEPDRAWRIGVQHPFDHARSLGTLELQSGMAVATSGNYERFVTINGKRYAHIIDPRSGLPVEGMAGVTVLSKSATEADALSTSLFVLGIEGAAELLARTPDSHALLVPDRQPVEIYVSKGLLPLFTPHPEFKTAVRPL
jgi:thiamine biosynthesis lipoprotein